MELGEEERYAAAALFSLALHLTQARQFHVCGLEHRYASLDLSTAAFADHRRQKEAVHGKHCVAGPVRRNSRRTQPAGGSGLGVTHFLLYSLLDCYKMRCLNTSGDASVLPRSQALELPALAYLPGNAVTV